MIFEFFYSDVYTDIFQFKSSYTSLIFYDESLTRC
jgi:hypothetical protein